MFFEIVSCFPKREFAGFYFDLLKNNCLHFENEIDMWPRPKPVITRGIM